MTTVPFGTIDPTPLEMLRAAGVEVVINPLGRKLRAEEVADVIAGFPVVIAGTETISRQAMAASPGLKAICRVGIGLDSVDLVAARELGIACSYTPDGPSPAVAELTVGLILDLLRGVGQADRGLRAGTWTRVTGRRVAASVVGVIGCGRIGGRVIRHLHGAFPGVRILAHDLRRDPALDGLVEWVESARIYAEADVVTLHVPLTPETYGLVGAAELERMKNSTVLVNTARGGIVDEAALAAALGRRVIAAAAVDVFEQEPYQGLLTELDNVLLTCHMGSMTADCRARMEVEATAEAIRFLKGDGFVSPVPEAEYDIAARMGAGR